MSRTYGKAQDLIDFTRASSGTALRRVKYGAELVTNGTFDTDSDWVKSGHWVISGGVATMPSTSSFLPLYQEMTFTAGNIYSVTLDVTAISGTIQIILNDLPITANKSNVATVNSTGTHTVLLVAEAGAEILAISRKTTASCTIDNISVKEVTFDTSDGDLILFNHPNNIPRIEYDANGNLSGLLVEEARTNLVTYSDDFTDSSWVATNFSTSGALPVVTANQAIAPDGTARADKIVFNAVDASGISALYHNVTGFNGQGCYSIWLKSDSGNVTLRLRIDYSGGSAAANITVTESWQRFDLTTASGLTGIYQVSLRLRPSQGTDTTGTIYAYNAQLEAGSFPTSAIPTSGSTATRSADVASLSTSAFGYRQDEGTVVVDWSSSHIPWNSYNRVFEIGENGVNSNISLLGTQGSAQTYVTINNNGSEQLSYSSNFFVVSQSTFYKTAIGIKKDDVNLAYNSILRTTDTSVNVPYMGAGAKLYIGGDRYGGARFTGYIKSLKYIPRRLTNDQLVEVTS